MKTILPKITPMLVGSCIAILLTTLSFGNGPKANSLLKQLDQRFAPVDGQPATEEVPDFQRHISPLLGKLGCNGRACHGSFQGQGGFQLSLFGYDFEEDYKALHEENAGRVDSEDKLESLILTKPVDEDMHEGGKRYEQGGWEYWVLRKWIEADTPFEPKKTHKLSRLVVSPSEVVFGSASDKTKQNQELKVIAHWEDGTVEDVTCLTRFHSNDSAIAAISDQGVISSGEVGSTHVVASYDKAVVPVAVIRPVSSLGKDYPQIATPTRIDELVQQRLAKLGIIPSEVCSDEQFLRRLSLDLTGTLPQPEEILDFIQDEDSDKRQRKIDELLEQPAYAAQWTTFLCDITGNNDDQLRNFLPTNVQPSDQWYQWILKRVDENMPYDDIVEGIVAANSRKPGESYRDYCEDMSEICRDRSGEKFAERPGLVYYWARNNFRTPEDRAIGFAYSFLGVRIQCAQCHKHPFDQWSKNDFDNFEKLFVGVDARQQTLSPDARKQFPEMVSELGVDMKLKGNQLRRELGTLLKKGSTVPFPELIIRSTAARNRQKKQKGKKQPVAQPKAKLLGGEWVAMNEPDPRGELMDWLRAPENPYFAKAFVNRVWAQYFGVGIVDPADDLSLANAPSNGPLLEYLAEGFKEHDFDMKWLHREILNSDCYQRSWETNATNVADKNNFSHSRLRRLPAEATYDAVRMAIANSELSAQASRLEADRALTRSGASAQVRRQDDESYALKVFGRSIRETNCDCDRSNEPSLLQTVFLLNDDSVQQWLTDPKTSWVAEIAEEYGWPAPTPSGNQAVRQQQFEKLARRYIELFKTIDRQISLAQKKEQTKTVQSLKSRRSQMLKKAKAAAARIGLEDELVKRLKQREVDVQVAEEGGETPSNRIDSMQAESIATRAYLKTLSRTPSEAELAIATNFLVSEEGKPTDAVASLLWSLVNTKEFILNH